MVGTHVAPAGAVTAHAWAAALMVGDPESVMRMAEVPVAADVMAVVGVNVTAAVVAVPLIWEPIVTAGPVMEPKMAGKLPEIDASSKAVPSLVVAAATVVMAACAAAGVVNPLKLKAT